MPAAARRRRAGRGAAKAEGKWPAVIVASIARYYGLQALEPSVRGFLAILEKQFDRADAYVWELLQNGVDDGATQVVVERLPERRGVRVSHDGRRFTPLDVLGLSSVGLSTKSLLSDGTRRGPSASWASVSRPSTGGLNGSRCPTGGGALATTSRGTARPANRSTRGCCGRRRSSSTASRRGARSTWSGRASPSRPI